MRILQLKFTITYFIQSEWIGRGAGSITVDSEETERREAEESALLKLRMGSQAVGTASCLQHRPQRFALPAQGDAQVTCSLSGIFLMTYLRASH